jgi:hypothetical protein
MFRSLFDHHQGHLYLYVFTSLCAIHFFVDSFINVFHWELFCTLHLYTYLSVEIVCVETDADDLCGRWSVREERRGPGEKKE